MDSNVERVSRKKIDRRKMGVGIKCMTMCIKCIIE